MSPEVGDNREILAYFYLCCKPFPFNLWRCGRLICVRLLFAVANNCLCQISDFENEFSVAICQIQQSTIATASLGLLKPAVVVRKRLLLEKFSVFRFPFCAHIGSDFHHMSFSCSYYSEIFTTFAKLLAYEK